MFKPQPSITPAQGRSPSANQRGQRACWRRRTSGLAVIAGAAMALLSGLIASQQVQAQQVQAQQIQAQQVQAPPAARSLVLQVQGEPSQAQAFAEGLAALGGGEQTLILQTRKAAKDRGFVVHITDPHNGGQTLVALQACSALTCVEADGPYALIFAREASPKQLAEALRRALGGFAPQSAKQTGSSPEAQLSLVDLVSYLSRQLRAPLRRPTAIAAQYQLDLTLFSPAPQDLQQAAIERLKALSLLQSSDAEALQEHLQTCQYCEERQALNQQLLTLLAADTNRETQLRQWQAVVAGAAPQGVFGYIAAYPNAAIAPTIIQDVAATWPDQLAAVEARLWADASSLADPNVMRGLILACMDCSFAEALEPEALTTANPELEAETALWQQARQENSADSYGSYLEDCSLCLFSPEALRLQQKAGPDPEALNDRRLLAAMGSEPSLPQMQAYLEGCQLCEQRDDIQARYDAAFARDTAQARCLDLARSPRSGGDGLQPREAAQAEEACLTALEQADSGALRLVLAESYRLQGKAERAVAAFDQAYQAGEADGLDGLALSLFQFSKAGSQGRRRLADIMANRPALAALTPRAALVEALIEIEQLGNAERLLPQPEIVSLLETAAEGQEAEAAYTLGLLYSFGQLTERDLGKAARAFQTAAALGHVEASAYYADHVERGLGVAADYKLAAELYYQALKGQSKWAETRLIDQGRSRPLEVMKHIQRFLRDEGLYRGPIDGVAGGTTTKALNRARERG